MMSDSQDIAEVLELAFVVHEELASLEQISQLESLCLQSRLATDVYLAFSKMRGNIYLRARSGFPFKTGENLQSADRTKLCISPSETCGPNNVDRATPSRNLFAADRGRKASISAPLSLLGSKQNLFRLAGCTILVALCVYGSFALIAWNLRPGKLPSFAAGNPDSVAMVCDTTDVHWSKHAFSKSAESPVLPGEPLKIESGTVELELNTGTKLVVEGPADWSVDGRNSVSLRVGKMTAHVPKQAIGFTIETPTATIVDLGTEFGVETDNAGATKVYVLEGKVELQPIGAYDSPPSRKRMTLTAGDGLLVESQRSKDKVHIRKLAPSETRFNRVARSSGAKPIVAQGTRASSTFPSFRVSSDNLLFDRGLFEGRHSADCESGLHWHTEFGHVKNEFVLFDLGRFHRLSAMKVWNYNEADCISRGVKQADIYVSDSGQGDPLSAPNKWRLIVAGQEFNPATGKPDYSTPDTIELASVEARYVAIVIKDRFGVELGPAKPEVEVVGLSEVQFFGEPVTQPKGPANR